MAASCDTCKVQDTCNGEDCVYGLCSECGCLEEECCCDESGPAWHNEHGVKFVNVYMVRRNWGGPEEGGWWFDSGELLEVHVAPDRESATRLAEKLEEDEFSNEGRRELGSVLSTGRYSIVVDDRPGEDWPEVRPRYE